MFHDYGKRFADQLGEYDMIMGQKIYFSKVPLEPSKDLMTSYGRYCSRIEKFKTDGKKYPRLRHRFWWLVHNIPAHLAIAFIPIQQSFKFHDWTSKKLNGE